MIRRRDLLVALMLSVMAFGAVIGYFLMQPREFEARASVFVGERSVSTLNIPQAALLARESSGIREYVFSVLDSADCCYYVVTQCNLLQNEAFWKNSRHKRTSALAVLRLKKRITLTNRAREPIKLAVSTIDRDLSLQIATAYLAFLEKRLFRNEEGSRDYWGGQVQKAAVRLQAAQKELLAFQEKSAMPVYAENQMGSELESFLQLRQSLLMSQAELHSTKMQLDAAGNLEDKLQLQSLGAGQAARVEDLEGAIQKISSRFKLAPKAQIEFRKRTLALKLREVEFERISLMALEKVVKDVTKDAPYEVVETPRLPEVPASRNWILFLGSSVACAVIVGMSTLLTLSPAFRVATLSVIGKD